MTPTIEAVRAPAPPPAVAAPCPRSRPRSSPPVAAALAAFVPGLGHAYAGAFGRAFLLFFVASPIALGLLAAHAVAPVTLLVVHGLSIVDAWRAARTRNGDWSPRAAKDARAAFLALVVALGATAIARSSGALVSPLLAVPLFMIVFGLSLARPGPRCVAATACPGAPAPAPALPAAPAPGQTVDRRVPRAELARALAEGVRS